jgi:multisubunit Na+/H+ antiporter MnhC subunit
MRKYLEAVSLTALAILLWITWAALYGPRALAGPIPTHFDLTGQPNAYGPLQMLLILPAIAIALYLLITVVGRNPSVFNYPVRVTPKNRRRLQDLALSMIAFLKAETVILFTLIQYQTIDSARNLHSRLPQSLMITGIAVIFSTIALYILAMRRSA